MKKITLISTFLLLAVIADGQPFMKLDAKFYSQALNEDRQVDIYLPGEYYLEPETAFPVIYYLHGGGGNQNEGSSSAMLYYGNHYSDTTITSPAAIFVCPDGSCEPYLGSMWLNSELYGNYEDYLINDVIGFIDDNFRTLDDRNFRFIHGFSMGGFGSSYQATKHPELFRAACPTHGAFSWGDTALVAWRDYLYDENNGYQFTFNAGKYSQSFFTLSGGFSPNLNNAPWYFDCLYDTLGDVVDDVYEMWQEFMVCKMIMDLPPDNNLAYFLICGTEDEMIFYPSNLELEDTLQKYGREFRSAYHNYGHGTFDPVTHKIMFNWVDSLIADAYLHLGISDKFRNKNTELRIDVFPNPVSQVANIRYYMDVPGDVEIAILSQLGQVSVKYNEGWKPAGMHQQRIDISGLSTGIYLLRISSDRYAGTIKFMKN
jgi:enterochelin esterase-like enzyme